MNTAKKRILSLTLTICLALSMMLTLSACGKKNLEEYFNTDTMQKLVTSSVEQYESQGMELKMYAEGDELHYDLTLTTIETTDDDRSMYAEALEAGLAETAQTFVDAAKDVQKSVSNETVLVVVTYFDAAGVELASQSFSSARGALHRCSAPLLLCPARIALDFCPPCAIMGVWQFGVRRLLHDRPDHPPPSTGPQHPKGPGGRRRHPHLREHEAP